MTPETKRRAARFVGFAGMACLVALSAGSAGAEVEFGLLLANDFGTASPRHDDLYTGAVGLWVARGPVELTLIENTFTDEVNVVRFDETWIGATGLLAVRAPWALALDGGVVHVGEGLLGESFQNFLHEIVGASEVSLPYIEDADWYGVLGLEAGRPWYSGERVTATVRLEGRQAFGFKGHALAVVGARWQLRPSLSLYGFVGPRYTETELAELKPWVHGLAPTGAIGLRYKSLLDVSYNYNDFGTEDHHWRVGLSWRFGKASGASPAESTAAWPQTDFLDRPPMR
jgi:hypothetical protein